MREILVLIILLLLGQWALAGELYEYYTSIRGLGMGNAYSAVVDGRDALYYNPAGLSQNKGFAITLADLTAGANRSDIVATAVDLQDQNKYISTIQNLYGKNIWGSGGGQAAITAPGIGFAAFEKLEASAMFNNPAATTIDLRYTNDYGFTFGASDDILPSVSIGASFSYIKRTGAVFPVGVSTLGTLSVQDLKNQLNNSGSGYNGSIGVLAAFPTPARPRGSLVFKNFGSTYFTRETGTKSLGSLNSEIDLGLAFDIPFPPVGKITPTVEYKYFNLTSEQLGKKIHLGVELDLTLLQFRAGFNQGYYTAGVGLNLKFLKFNAATYGVELGEYPGQLEDRRYVASVTMEFGFDGGFFSNSNQGKNSGEKGGRGGPSSGIKPRR